MCAVIHWPFVERFEKEWRCEGTKRQKVRSVSMDSSSDDVLYEVMKHMDPKSLATAACVSTKWKKVAEDETLWENVCIQHWSSPSPSPVPGQGQLRSVVFALGGFRRLYVQCLQPLSSRGRLQPQAPPSSFSTGVQSNAADLECTKDEVQLSLSLFSIDCYERLRRRHLKSSSSSLRPLCKPSANLSLGRRHLLPFPKRESNVR